MEKQMTTLPAARANSAEMTSLTLRCV